MFKNDKYVYGPSDSFAPINLNLAQFMLDKLAEGGDAVALINAQTDERITFREILQHGMSFAVSLYDIGIRKGQNVAICSENRLEVPATLVGILSTGATVTTINLLYTKGEIKHALNISKPEFIICSPLALKTHEKVLRSLPFIKKIIIYGKEPFKNTLSYNELLRNNDNVTLDKFNVIDVKGQSDVALILYSSGTTGLAKGVMLTHLNVIASCSQTGAAVFKDIIGLSISPWFHTMGLITLIMGLSNNRLLVYMPKFEIELFLRSIEKYKVNFLTVVPPVLVALTKYQGQADLSSVLMIASGAAPLHKETIEDAMKKFPNLQGVIQAYGMTETTLAVTRDLYTNPEKSNMGTVGTVTPCCTIKIVDLDTRQPLGPNQHGEICVKSVMVMKGYIGKDRRDDFDDEGFFRTGDIGYYDDEGFFFIVDRLKELIKYKANQVPPAEIEAVLLSHPSIRDAGVVGVPRKDVGEVPYAFVVLQPGAQASEEDVKAFVAERLSNPKHLRGGVKFIQEIPKNPSGKILRRVLKEMLKNKRSKL